MSSSIASPTAPLASVLPSYAYQQYADDENIVAFVDAFNGLSQGYLDWFNQTPLGVYTSPQISGPLLDWVANGLYGIERPVFSSGSSVYQAGLNAFALNAGALNGHRFTQTGTATIASDDYFKRTMTWILYLGDTRVFNCTMLRKRVARFLFGVNGGDITPSQAQQVSITAGSVPGPSHPALSQISGGALPARTYGAQQTYVTPMGESLAGSASSLVVEAPAWNPNDKNADITLSGGNLIATGTVSGAWYSCRAALGMATGKWYWEVAWTTDTGPIFLGVANSSASLANYIGGDTNGYGYYYNGNSYNGQGGAGAVYGAAYAAGDVIGTALDMDAGTVTWYKNGVSQGVAFTGITGTMFPGFSSVQSGNVVTANFGATAFAYTPPAGFSGLVSGGSLLVAGSPPVRNGVIGWNLYANILSTNPGKFIAGLNASPLNAQPLNGTNKRWVSPPTRQNSAPIPLGDAWTEPITGLIEGAALPVADSSNPAQNLIIDVPSGTASRTFAQALSQGALPFPFMLTASVNFTGGAGVISGYGASAQAPQTASGSGNFTTERFGTGAATQAPQTANGSGFFHTGWGASHWGLSGWGE